MKAQEMKTTSKTIYRALSKIDNDISRKCQVNESVNTSAVMAQVDNTKCDVSYTCE